MDGFRHYATGDMTLKWGTATGGGVSLVGGPTSGGYAYWTDNSYKRLARTLDDQTTWVVGVRHLWSGQYNSVLLSTGGDLLHCISYGTGVQVRSEVTSDGRISVTTASGTYTTSVPVLTALAWRYIEMKVFISSTVGTIDVRVDGDDVLNLTGINTNPVGIGVANTVGIGYNDMGHVYGNTAPRYTDYYVCDGTGATNNDFLGDIEVQTLFPTGSGNNSQWSPLSGSNWENVEDGTPDYDTSYVYASLDGAIDTYTYSDMTAVSGVVRGIQHNIFARKASSGTVHVKPVSRPNATDFDGDSVALSNSYQTILEVEEINPETGIGWTISDVNNAQFGQKVVA
jgi:hypothetical protein